MRLFPKLPLVLLATLLQMRALPLLAGVGDEEMFLAEISVASPLKSETVFNSLSNVTVIDRDTIERYGFSSVPEALESVAGVMVWRTYLMQRIPTFRGGLQEHYATKVLVMINNVPAWDAVTGEGDLDRVSIDAVERIEILRGPGSVLYGSNAQTGAINIVLRKPNPGDQRVVEVVGGLGTGHGKFEGQGGVSRAGGLYSRADQKDTLFASAHTYGEAFPLATFTDESRTVVHVREGLQSDSVNLAGTRGGHTYLLNAANSRQSFLGNVPAAANGARFTQEKGFYLGQYAYAWEPSWGKIQYALTYDWTRRNIPRNDKDDIHADIVGSRAANVLSGRFPLPGRLSLEVGGSHDYRVSNRYVVYTRSTNATTTESDLRGRKVWEGSGFAQLEYDGNPWQFLAGTRYTKNELFGNNVSSRGSLIYKFSDRHSVKLIGAQAYRAPTLFELYFLTRPVTAGGVVGNPKLKPETSDSAEVAYLLSWGKFFAHVTEYYVRYKDTIQRTSGDFCRDGEPTCFTAVNYYTNLPDFEASGTEVELRYGSQLSSVFVAFDAVHGTKGDKRTVSAPSPNTFGLSGGEVWNYKFVPDYTLSGGVAKTLRTSLGDFFASAVGNYYPRLDTLRSELPDSAWVDVSLGVKKGPWRHAIALKNVSDEEVDVPEYARQRVLESVPLLTGPRAEYTFSYQF